MNSKCTHWYLSLRLEYKHSTLSYEHTLSPINTHTHTHTHRPMLPLTSNASLNCKNKTPRKLSIVQPPRPRWVSFQIYFFDLFIDWFSCAPQSVFVCMATECVHTHAKILSHPRPPHTRARIYTHTQTLTDTHIDSLSHTHTRTRHSSRRRGRTTGATQFL